MKGNLFRFGILKSTTCTHTAKLFKVQREDAERLFIQVYSQRARVQKLALCPWKQYFVEEKSFLKFDFLKFFSFSVNIIAGQPWAG